jgi:hypothetical protein
MDVLQGDLESFPLSDVVRLVADGERTGVLRVETGPITGRIFLVAGRLTYATTRGGDGSVSALARLGTRSERDRRGRNPEGKWPDPARPLILRQIAEVMLRLDRGTGGRFWFVEGVMTRAYGVEEVQRFTVDEVLAAAESRREEWGRIVRILPDAGGRFVMRPTLPGNENDMVVDASSWCVLAVMGDGASAQDVAERLNLFEMSAAGLLADLYESGMIVLEYALPEASVMPGTTVAGK